MTDAWEARATWVGHVRRSSPSSVTAMVRAPRERARSSGTGAFLGIADDRRQYWVKVPGNPQGDQVLVNEVIVAGVGAIIGAPVRDTVLLRVPANLTAWSQFPARKSDVPLLAHGSLHLDSAIDDDGLQYTKHDDNARRQSRMVGLWDLCLGDDPQWAYDASASYSVWSYDHGLWFTTIEGDWNEQILVRLLGVDGSYPSPPDGLDVDELVRTAKAIEAISPPDLLAVVSAVPVEWGTSDSDLEAMAWFLYLRRRPVARRIRSLALTLTSPLTGTST